MGRYKAYSKEFKVKVAKEAMLPENERCEHIIAEKYGIMPWTVRKWKSLYLEYGEIAFSKGFTKIVANNDQTALERENAELREEIEILKKSSGLPSECKAGLKFQFMYLHRYEHGIARMAKVLEVSESGYYKWMKKLNGPLTEKEMEDLELTREIYDIFKKYHGIFGARKITVLLNKGRKESVNHKRVERIMSENMLYAKTSKRYVKTTDSDHDEPIADNLVARDFLANAADQKFLSDTTVVATDKGYLYAAVILDLYGRIPVGLAMSTRNDKHLVMNALEDMLIRGRGGKDAWIHSDRGSTYCSEAYRNMLIANGFICSMSRKGDCWDNAPMESFWGKMKTEWMQKKYATIEAAKRDIYEYVWSFYPKQRPHASLGYLTPVEYYNQAINY